MIKLVKRIGNSIGVIFDIEDRELYDLALGKAVDIEIRKVFKIFKPTFLSKPFRQSNVLKSKINLNLFFPQSFPLYFRFSFSFLK